MVKPLYAAALFARPAVTYALEPLPERQPAEPLHPVWDDGTDYDIPTYLRRRRSQAGPKTRPGRRMPFEVAAAWSRLGG